MSYHPITHHTSHTMENGASSSSSGSNQNGAECVHHHTSHTMENGASSSAGGSGGANGTSQTENATGPNATHDSNVNTIDRDAAGEDSALSSSAASTVPDDYDSGMTSSWSSVGSVAPAGNLNNFHIIDTTLREGEQFANAWFDRDMKLKIAKALDDFGVDYIEVVSPAASEASRADVEAICKLGLKAKVLTHIRCNLNDAKIAVETGVDGINLFMGTSKQHMENSHGKGIETVTKMAAEVIEYVRSHNIEVRFSGEDSFRSDFKEILKLYTLVDRLGVCRVGIADTVGGATPMEVYNKVSSLRENVSCDIGTHFHNDTGCAVANAITALEAGATHIDTCILGIGERNGITPLSGLCAGLMPTSREYLMTKYNLKALSELDAMIAQMVGVEIPWNNRVVEA